MINYSSRFTITGLTGATAETYRNAVTALDGSTNGPLSVGDGASSSTAITVSTTATATTGAPTSLITTKSHSRIASSSSAIPSASSSSAPLNINTGELSSGVLAGIAIAGVVVGLIGIGFGLWMYFRRKRRRDAKSIRLGDDNSDLSGEVFRQEMVATTPPVELDPYARIVEADHGTPPVEMDSMNVRVELEGDSVHAPDIKRPDSSLTEVPPTPVSPMTIGTGTWNSMRYPLPDPIITPETPGTPVTPLSNV